MNYSLPLGMTQGEDINSDMPMRHYASHIRDNLFNAYEHGLTAKAT